MKTKKFLDPWCLTLMLAIKSAQSEEAKKRRSDDCISKARRSRLGCLKDQVAELGASVGYTQANTAQGIIGWLGSFVW